MSNNAIIVPAETREGHGFRRLRVSFTALYEATTVHSEHISDDYV